MKYKELIEVYQKVHFLWIVRNECQRTLTNLPSKVTEAMAYGVVPVVSDVGDYTKYFLQNERDSIFIKGDSIDETRKAIRKEEYKCYSINACKTAKERFDYRIWMPRVKQMQERG